MNFDQLGAQHVYKRRKPSPVKKAMHQPPHLNADFPQHVWRRQRRAAEASSSAQKGPEPVFSRRSSGFSIPGSWLKNAAIAAGLLIIAIVGPNWDNIAARFKIVEVSQKSLEDPSAPLEVMEAEFRPIGYSVRESLYARTESSVLPYEGAELNLTDTFSWTEYKVQQGDTVSGIAERYSLSMGSIIAFNQLNEAWNLRSGKVLKIPNMDGVPYTIKKGDTISAIAAKMKVPQNAILDANDILNENIPAGKVIFIPGGKMDANELSRAIKRPVIEKMIYPVNNKRVTSNYGWREDPVNPVAGQMTFHRAVDLAGRMGDPVKAALKGTVLHIDNNRNLGNFIILKHGEYQTLYAHLSAVLVKKGEEVNQGQMIGKVGETGYTTGPHLHFEVFRNGNRINPLEILK
ncbi:MAG: M23 family metallopeptidase [Treponema sp.]|jgi:murein DD-endopeptidase MepM/ murein hydrolase activator NlpD|nr:M23 family metallopeptidase [Treponema sp.]